MNCERRHQPRTHSGRDANQIIGDAAVVGGSMQCFAELIGLCRMLMARLALLEKPV